MMFQLLTSFFCSIHVTGTQHTQSINSEFRRTLIARLFFQFSFKAQLKSAYMTGPCYSEDPVLWIWSAATHYMRTTTSHSSLVLA